MRDLKDEELLEVCREGDEAAWRELVTRYERLVFSTALQTGLERDVAADVFQQVWIECHRSLFRIRDGKALPRWLIVTTRRISYRQAVVAGRWLHDVREDLVDETPPPDSAVVQLEERHHLEQAFDRLDERCQTILRLLFLADEKTPYAEVAEQAGVATDSVGPMRTRCLDKLRAAWEAVT